MISRTLTLAVCALLAGGSLLGPAQRASAAESTGTQPAGTEPPSNAPTLGPCQVPAPGGSSVVKVASGGLTRTAVLHLPPTPAAHPLPLLIALHGYGGTGARFERDTGFSNIADRDGFAVLYPDAHGSEWVINGSNRDVEFISQLISHVESLACIEPRRIYATGVSNGGRMAARLGCALSAQIAAIAPVAGGYSTLPACQPERPISVLEIHGTADTTVPYEGKGPEHAGAVLPYVFAWASRDGCTTQPSKEKIALHTLRYRWSGCRGGATVEHLRIYGGAHGMPDSVGAEISSGGPYTISGAEQVWRFLAPITLSPVNSS
jgi:polyhydroxybutyrate depolymerase